MQLSLKTATPDLKFLGDGAMRTCHGPGTDEVSSSLVAATKASIKFSPWTGDGGLQSGSNSESLLIYNRVRQWVPSKNDLENAASGLSVRQL
jgi:hypothetical protein